MRKGNFYHGALIASVVLSTVAQQVAELEPLLDRDYEASYGYQVDQTLYVGVISEQNQIANGFSTQSPLNQQINYMGGTQMVDMFTSEKWIDNLIYHETVHNYQINPKASDVTKGICSIFGNGSVTLGMFPLLAVPNFMLTSFTLEGNAVLNESIHGNAGRLYSGRFKALTVMQAKAGNITPQF